MNCPLGLYANTFNNTCDPCALGCSACYGPEHTDCTACLTLNVSGTLTPYYKYLTANTCNTTCPISQLIDGN